MTAKALLNIPVQHCIKTKLPDYYVSTVWEMALDTFETMAFKRKGSKIDWSGILTYRAKNEKLAVEDHCRAIRECYKLRGKL